MSGEAPAWAWDVLFRHPDGVVVVDRGGRVVGMNQAAAEVSLASDAVPVSAMEVGALPGRQPWWLEVWLARADVRRWLSGVAGGAEEGFAGEELGSGEMEVEAPEGGRRLRLRWRGVGELAAVYLTDETALHARLSELERYAADVLGAKVAYERQAEELAQLNRMLGGVAATGRAGAAGG